MLVNYHSLPNYKHHHLIILLLFIIYLVGNLTGVAASKWHMTPKKNQAKSTQMHTDAADASKSKQKLRHWIKKLQINKKNNLWKSRIMHCRQTKAVIGKVMGSSWRRSIYFRKGSWVSGAGKSIQGWGTFGHRRPEV